MLLTIATTYQPATDLGYLLYKHPDRVQNFSLSSGKAHVFYPQADNDRCECALLLDIDPVRLVRGNDGSRGEGFTLSQYVNDRPYVASSLLSVAISQVFGTALNGTSKDRPELVNQAIPLEVHLSALPASGEGDLIRALFEPLGYEVHLEPVELDPRFPQWGQASVFAVNLRGKLPLSDLLSHLYVLIPVLDNEKHYWVGEAEVEKLLRHGEGWLQEHPAQEVITRRYLKHQRSLFRPALEALSDDGQSLEITESKDEKEDLLEKKQSLHELRLHRVLEEVLRDSPRSVLDLGCGEGKLLKLLQDHIKKERQEIGKVVGVDVSYSLLERAARRLRLDGWPHLAQETFQLLQSSLLYGDSRLEGFDVAALVEVIEHIDLPKLAFLQESLFGAARPRKIIITTPNRDYNGQWESLSAGEFRHRDHRFEWTREEFQSWASLVAEEYHYSVVFEDLGEAIYGIGGPSQMGVFRREQ